MENVGTVGNVTSETNAQSKEDYIAELVYENEKLKLENEALRKILGEKEQKNQQSKETTYLLLWYCNHNYDDI